VRETVSQICKDLERVLAPLNIKHPAFGNVAQWESGKDGWHRQW